MAENNKNALTELSEKLAMYADFHKEEDKANKGILTKASKIIAQLAKVKFGETGHVEWVTGADMRFAKCREIAEKGTK